MVSGNVPAAIPARDTASARPNNEHSSPRDYAGFDPSVRTGSNPGARTVSQLALQPSKKKGKVQSKNDLSETSIAELRTESDISLRK
jgi:hypothetical protein